MLPHEMLRRNTGDVRYNEQTGAPLGPVRGLAAGLWGSGRGWGLGLGPDLGSVPGSPRRRAPPASQAARLALPAISSQRRGGGGDFQSCDLHKPPRAANGRAPLPESFAWGRAAANGGGGAVGAASSRAG